MAQYKTPGVYIEELDAFPNSVVEVPTAIPAFFGYTEEAEFDGRDLTGVPTRIDNLAEYQTYFGGPDTPLYSRVKTETLDRFETPQRFHLYWAIRHFFDNGGGPCWIVSVGGYDGDKHSADDFTDDIWNAAAKEREPAIYLCPDAVALDRASYVAISNRMLAECQSLADRVAIVDIYDGRGDIAQAIDGPDGFRNALRFGDNPGFGVAYYPWLNTTLIEQPDADFTDLDEDSRKALAKDVFADLQALQSEPLSDELTELVKRLTQAPTKEHPADKTHTALYNLSPLYSQVMQGLRAEMNVLPPSGAMAGVYARTDSTFGVFKAPANTGIQSVASPVVSMSHEEQQGLNVPLNGLAVNAIRSFLGRGVLVWGARTLDGNSQDWRYVSVRRTLIMLEQSIKSAAQAYVFAANDDATWATVRAMIENFLTNQWKAGALAGSTPDQAFGVDVGLGSTMTAQDVLDGYMNVAVRVAVTRPAEFIVITFQQKMQTS